MSELDTLRAQIREIDMAILDLLIRRTGLAREVGACKRAQGLPILDEEVELHNRAERLALLHERGVSPGQIEPIFDEIVRQAREVQ